jgi:pyrophosphatase PpaX
MKEYKYYLFDADGTLIDTIELIYQCFKHTLATYGKRAFGRQEIVEATGMTLRNQFAHHLGPITDEQFAQISAHHMQYQLSIYKNYLRLLPGVLETLQHLKSRGKRLAVVSSRRKDTLGLYLKVCGIDAFFDFCITPEDTKNHKPHPEPALVALSRIGAKPHEALFVGDSVFDMQCARDAAIDSALVCPAHADARTMPFQPTYTIPEITTICMQEPLMEQA